MTGSILPERSPAGRGGVPIGAGCAAGADGAGGADGGRGRVRALEPAAAGDARRVALDSKSAAAAGSIGER